MPLTAEELKAHPSYQNLEWDLPPTREGRAEVAKGRSGGPFKLNWEIHGDGETKLVVSLFELNRRCVRGLRNGRLSIDRAVYTEQTNRQKPQGSQMAETFLQLTIVHMD